MIGPGELKAPQDEVLDLQSSYYWRTAGLVPVAHADWLGFAGEAPGQPGKKMADRVRKWRRCVAPSGPVAWCRLAGIIPLGVAGRSWIYWPIGIWWGHILRIIITR